MIEIKIEIKANALVLKIVDFVLNKAFKTKDAQKVLAASLIVAKILKGKIVYGKQAIDI